MKSLLIHFLIGWLLVGVTLAMVGFYVPGSDETIGSSYLIFFFHFPSAINCLNLFLFSGALSLLYLRGQQPRWDLWAASAAEVGVLACTVTLVTGSIWAKAAWGIWWSMTDPRLMSVAVMWLTYLSYLALRSTIDEPVKRARFCAVFGVIACLNVPIVHFSIRVLGKENHPMEVDLGATSMIVTRWFGAMAFFVLYTAFWRLRYRVAHFRDLTHQFEERLARSGL
ncbi:MAG: cytochrome c biogenesis protein [Planctomycetes bacterium]|nr:cytochrome c biogenesis protein [Planctomycetota bacterium]